MNKEIQKRLQIFREQSGLNKTQFADRLSFNQSNYTQIELGNRTINTKLVIALIESFDINLNWLFKGDGNAIETNEGSYNLDSITNMVNERNEPYGSSNLFVPIKEKAGYLHEFSQEKEEDFERIYIPNTPNNSRTFEIEGDSMYPY